MRARRSLQRSPFFCFDLDDGTHTGHKRDRLMPRRPKGRAMKNLFRLRWIASGSFLAGALTLPLPVAALCPIDLSAAVESVASRPELERARLGVHVETLAGDYVYGRDSDRFFVPASALKLVTTAAVLTQLGPDFALQTSVHGQTTTTGTTTLQVVGQGDPSFDDAGLQALATQIAQQGIRRVDTLYGDDTYFQGSPVNPNWEWEDVQAGYGAPINTLILNQNEIGFDLVPQAIGQPLKVVWDNPTQAIDWQIENHSVTVSPGESEFVNVGQDLTRPVLRIWGQLIAGSPSETASIAVLNPGKTFLTALQSALIQQNITVQQTALPQSPLPSDWSELATVQSPTLAELLIPANRDSNNLYAEALLKQLGQQTNADDDATRAGSQTARRVLSDLGVDPTGIVMVDGSGLARKNLITPTAMVDVLQAMARSPLATPYRDSLAVAGVSGTLRNRWRDTSVEGRLWGKSGAISRNFALAGYLEPIDYQPVAFSIFINNIDYPGGIARQLIDDIVLTLAGLASCVESQ